jgi:alkylhydroperoxidase/carboxymuconolactone decarboxylase family protein YurZ
MGWTLDHIEILRRLAINDEHLLEELFGAAGDEGDTPQPDRALDPRMLALVRLAALAAVGGAVSSYGSQADAAVDAGASAAEMVDVLVGVVPVVGIPCVVAAAPKLALALGYDSDEALDQFT